MASEVEARADFSAIRYAQCWEDADVLLEALDVRPGDACLSIASAGDNTLSLLARHPSRVVAVDLSHAQLACLELRVAAYRELSHAEVLELVGSSPSARRSALYQRCRPALSPETRAFWDGRAVSVERGIGAAGKFERYFEIFRSRALPLVHRRGMVERLLRGGAREEREAFYAREWDNWRWRLLFRVFFSRFLMGRLGRDPAFFTYVEGSVGDRLLARTRHAVTHLDPADNPYLQWILTGRHRTALPFALRRENFDAIRANLDRLEWHRTSLETYLESQEAGEFSRFNLSDIFEYMSPESTRRLLERVADRGRRGARLAYWNTLVPRSRPEALADRLLPLTKLAEELHRKDKAFFYCRFVVEEVRENGGRDMRIAIGQLWQETNTFNPLPTTRADFEAFGVLRGQEVIDRMADTNEPGGFIQSLRAWPERPEIVGLVRLPAWPSGIATRETFAWIEQEMLAALGRAGSVDALLLALHGAMVADGTPDVEGAVLERVGRRLGDVPIVATLDLHANVTARMVRSADALVLYHTAPHIDVFETGQRAAAVLRRTLIDGARPRTAFCKLPMVVPAERANTQDAASVSHAFARRLREMEATPGVLAAGLATVQPWLDIPEMGSAVLVVADEEQLARSLCAGLAAEVWQRRREYLPDLVSIDDAIAQAKACPDGLVVLSDSADATTSGAPGDSTHLLAALLRHDWPRPALVTLVDPQLVAELSPTAPGASWTGELGGKRDHLHSRPLKVTMEYVRRFEARFVLSGHLGRNLPIDMGASVVLRRGNVRVIVTSRSGPHFAPELFRAAGFDPFAASVLVAKSPCGFRAAYAEKAAKVLVVRAPGCAPSDFWNYPYLNIPRPLWPWDEIDRWEAEVSARS